MKMDLMKKKKKKGFTLIELIIVVAIIGILAAIAIPKFANIRGDAVISADLATAQSIENAAKMAIARGEITPSAITIANLATSAGTAGATSGTVAAPATTDVNIAKTIENNFDGSLTPQDSTKHFNVVIDAKGGVKVTVV